MALLLTTAGAALAQERHTFRFAREGVLGSSSLLVVEANDELGARAVEATVYAEVDRLAGILSTWDATSDFARLCRQGHGKAPGELLAVLRQAEHWREASHGAFEPGVATLTALWQTAAQSGEPPTAAALQTAVATLGKPRWTVAGDEVTVHGPVSLDAIAKGHVVDLAARAGDKAAAGARLLSFQIGGDMRLGSTPQEVALADPRHPTANGQPLLTLRVADAAVASSGGYARGFDVAGVHHSHILDPRTGKPCDEVLGTSVVAKDVATADALATILCVLGPADGLAFLAAVPDAHGVLVTADGKVHESSGLHALVVDAVAAGHAPAANRAWPAGFALQVEFEIAGPAATGGRGRGGWKRPYVAVWIEDATGAPARTLCLWIEDRRWLRDLRRWNRQHTEMPRLVDLVSQATRKAGQYTLTWDGTDDEGRTLAPGKYTVLLEVAREHGTYQLMKKELELGADPVRAELEGNEEIAGAKITFGKVGKKGG